MKFLTFDDVMRIISNDPTDMAASCAAEMFEVPLDQVTETQRIVAKQNIFCVVYGGSAKHTASGGTNNPQNVLKNCFPIKKETVLVEMDFRELELKMFEGM